MSEVRASGGYRDTVSFQTATLIYDATVWFCEKFIDPKSRTVDQMVQAARSGRQNIAEGSRASASSSQTELRLVNTARASLEELLLDYEDFLRQHHAVQWRPDSPEALDVRAVPARFRKGLLPLPAVPAPSATHDPSDPSDPSDHFSSPPRELKHLTDAERRSLYSPWLESPDPVRRANTLICLINQANYLLDQQVAALEKQFIQSGGYSERLAAERLAYRSQHATHPAPNHDRSDPTDRPDPSALIPPCPKCGKPMVLRTAKGGPHPGSQFWGCSAYPDCRGLVDI